MRQRLLLIVEVEASDALEARTAWDYFHELVRPELHGISITRATSYDLAEFKSLLPSRDLYVPALQVVDCRELETSTLD